MRYAILPCNGLDKSAGPVVREAALWLVSHADGELVCPVLLNKSPERYTRVLGELPLLVIDGCATQCRDETGKSLGSEDRSEAPGGGRSEADGCDPRQIARAESG